MNKEGEIIIIEDDLDDQEILQDVFTALAVRNKIVFFPNGTEVLEYLVKPDILPFLILSDINLPVLNGFDIRNRVFENEEISSKCIPYIFFTTAADERAVVTAYSLSAQGYFQKPSGFEEVKMTIKTIIEYWSQCYSPNTFRRNRL